MDNEEQRKPGFHAEKQKVPEITEPSNIPEIDIKELSKIPELTGKERAEANLIPIPKGVSGNPAGRPKGLKNGIRAQLNHILRKEGKQAIINKLKEGGIDLDDSSASGVIAGVLIDKSQDGCKDSIRMVLDQTEAPMPRNLKVEATLEITKIERLILSAPEVIEIDS